MKSFHRRAGRPPPTPATTTADLPPERHGLQRVDSLLVAHGQAPSRGAAQRLIAAGRVRLQGQLVHKASQTVSGNVSLEVLPEEG